MKLTTFLLSAFLSLAIFSAQAANPFEINTSRVGVSLTNNDKDMVVKFSENLSGDYHTIIDLSRISDLEYKTRVMRYFGGMLKNNTYTFEKIIVQTDNENYEMEFTRANVCLIVNLMCEPQIAANGAFLASQNEM